MASLTVIVPNYNHAKYLPESLDSILRQTRPAEELIVIDDASTDDSAAVIRSKLHNVRYARFEQNVRNVGYIASVNRLIGTVRSDVLFFASADDVFYPSLFEIGMNLLEQHPAAALFSARSDLIDAKGERRQFNTPVPITAPGYIGPAAAARFLLRDDSWFMGNVSLYRRDKFMAAGGLSEDLGAFADGYLARVLALRYGACFTPQVLGGWRRLDSGMAMEHVHKIAKADAVIESIKSRMEHSGAPFPPGYAGRWGGRQLFGLHRTAVLSRMRASSGLRRFWLAVWGSVKIARLFIALRPQDVVPVMRRRAAAVVRSIFS